MYLLEAYVAFFLITIYLVFVLYYVRLLAHKVFFLLILWLSVSGGKKKVKYGILIFLSLLNFPNFHEYLMKTKKICSRPLIYDKPEIFNHNDL